MSYVAIIITFVLIDNFVLTYFMGMRPIVSATRHPGTALATGLAATLVMTFAAIITWALRSWVLEPLGVEFLQTFIFVLAIAAIGHYLELLIAISSPTLRRTVGKYLPIVSTNCIVLGIAFVSARADYTAAQSIVAGLAAGGGFILVSVVVATIRERLEFEWVPRSFRGVPIAFVTTGLMALAFLAFDRALLGNLVG